MPITIYDVARKAGVDIATVSRVLNHHPYVRDAVRARVQAAVAELGFVPNVAAQRLALNRTFTVAMAFGSAPPDVVGTAVVSATRATSAQGYTMAVVLFDPADPASRESAASLAWRKQADGLLVVTTLPGAGPDFARRLPKGFPWVHVGGPDTPPDVPSVNADDRAGAYALAEYLLAAGHRRIGLVSSDKPPFAGRLAGFQAALAAHGMTSDPRCLVMVRDLGYDSGVNAGRTLLALDPRPTAISTTSDALAAGVIEAADEAGLDIPGSLAVTGFDDFPVARFIRPPLTTVHVPLDEMVRVASEMLIELIEGRRPHELEVHVPVTLVIRQSTGPCPTA